MRSSSSSTSAFATSLLRAMGLAAILPIAACGGKVVVDGEANGSGSGGDGAGGTGGTGGSGASGGAGGAGGGTPCVPTVEEGQKLKHVCLASCPPEGEAKAALSPLVSSESCDEWCCTSTWISSIECGPLLENGQCCFDLTTTTEEICMGRPFMARDGGAPGTRGRARVARGEAQEIRGSHPGEVWADRVAPETEGLDEDTFSALSAAWLRDALFEHASIASFARFVMELLAVGAPAELVAAAQQAASDEVAHTRACFGLAAAYSGSPVGPGPLDVSGAEIRTSLADVAEAVAEEGCVGETLSALAARAALAGATDPTVRAVLSRIVAEEEAHAALAWRFVAWAIARGDAETTARVRRVFGEMRGVPSVQGGGSGGDAGALRARSVSMGPLAAPNPGALRAHGRLTAAEQLDVFRRGMTEVVLPCSAALLASVQA